MIQATLKLPFKRHQGQVRTTTTLNLMIVGGQEAVKVILDTIPMLILAIFLVNILKTTGAIALLETVLTPLFHLIGFPALAGFLVGVLIRGVLQLLIF